MKVSFLLGIPFFLIATVTADTANTTKLRLDIPKGKTVKMTSQISMDYYTDRSLSEKLMSMDMQLENQYTVKDRLENGVHSIGYRISRLLLNQEMGTQTVAYDSDNPESSDPMNSMLHQQFSQFVDKETTFKVNNLGEVVEQPEVASSAAFNIQQMTGQLFIHFPEQGIQKDFTWTKENEMNAGEVSIKVLAEYTVTAITKEIVSVQVTVNPVSIDAGGFDQEDMKLEQAGNMMFDKKTGQLVSMVMNQSVAVKDASQGEIFVVSTTEIKSE